MTRRLSLICALPHPNPGMYSVDLAFDAFAARHGLHVEVTRYCYGGPHHASGLDRHTLQYASLAERFDEVVAADLILYWGDYQHAHSYWRSALHNGPNRALDFADEQAETAYLAEHLLLAGQPAEVLRKTLSFGSTLIGDDRRSTTTDDSAYRTAFPRFLADVGQIWFRDPISAAQAGVLRGDGQANHLGVDCAHLLTADDYRSIAGLTASGPGTGDHAVVFFGRLEGAVEEPARLAGRLARDAGLETIWVPWLGANPDAVAAVQAVIPDLTADPAPAAYEALIARVATARLVITDAYHLCLIAWRLGVPAVCLGRGGQRAVRPISDKKKEVFYLTQRLSPLYLFHERIADPSSHPGLAREVLEVALDPGFVADVGASLDVQVSAAEAELGAAIDVRLS
jgi:hypothetical protein